LCQDAAALHPGGVCVRGDFFVIRRASRRHTLTAGLLAGLLGWGVALSLASSASGSGVPIVGVSGEYPAPAVNQWAVQVSSLYGETVNDNPANSIIALNEYAQGLTNFGVTDFPYGHPVVSNYYPSGAQAPFQYVPLVTGADCFAFNLRSASGKPLAALRLNSSALAGIYTGTITKWNDPTLAALNPGVALPDSGIVPVVRSDPAMESSVLSAYLRDKAPAVWDAYTAAIGGSSDAQVVYPVGTSGVYQAQWLSESGEQAVAEHVKDGPAGSGTIGYLAPAYASLFGLRCASVQNSSGFFTQPTDAHISDALKSTVQRSDTSANPYSIIDSRHSGAYPLSWYAMAVTQTSQTPPGVGATLGTFLKFAVCQGQAEAPALGYAALPPRLVEDAFAAIRRINGAADPGPVTAANCPNPYLTGSL
jgi:ABC-type phosphate transport system substrate-binding protein